MGNQKGKLAPQETGGRDPGDAEGKASRQEKGRMTPKRICALLIVILLVLLYLVTLVTAVLDRSTGMYAFRVSLFATVAVPLLAWIYIWLYGKITGRRTIADPPEISEQAEAFPEPEETPATPKDPGR